MTPNQKLSASIPALHPSLAIPPPEHRPFSDPNRLAPEDAFYAHSPPKRRLSSVGDTGVFKEGIGVGNGSNGIGVGIGVGINGGSGELGVSRTGTVIRRPREKEKDRGRSRSRRSKGVWKKLLWIKQEGYPDNYTDPPTFLAALQRNPRLLPYDFWPLVSDSTVIVQHVCSVAVFVSCFVGIIQERVSPVSVVGWASALTVLGWIFWDSWVGQEEAARSLYESAFHHAANEEVAGEDTASVASTWGSERGSGTSSGMHPGQGLGLSLSTATSPTSVLTLTHSESRHHSRNLSATSVQTASSIPSPVVAGHPTGASQFANSYYPPYNAPAPPFSQRNQQRLATAKSAVLIYCALLGLSPILKSLTKSTTSDSIWAMSSWLMCINVFFFDYGGGVGVKFPASLSTNAALMASTVLASRLPSITHVFSLTLFSIEVFGLFPVFRRHLRHRSWRLHVALTVLSIIAAGTGLGITLIGGWVVTAGLLGILIWGAGTVFTMGACSWWLIGLQKYKNVVIGPWDPARPVIRGGWD